MGKYMGHTLIIVHKKGPYFVSTIVYQRSIMGVTTGINS